MLPSVLMTLGFKASVVGSNIVPGPYSWDAGQAYTPGNGPGEVYRPGNGPGEVYRAGTQAGQSYKPGTQAGEVNQ